MYGAAKIPQQRLPLSKKTDKWRKECIDAFINISKFGLSERRSNLKALYDYYNGEVDETDYRYVIKPYGRAERTSHLSLGITPSSSLSSICCWGRSPSVRSTTLLL